MSFDFNYPVVELISDSERQSLQDRAKGRGEKEAEGGGRGGRLGRVKTSYLLLQMLSVATHKAPGIT